MRDFIQRHRWFLHISVWWAAISTFFLYAADNFPTVQQQITDWLPVYWKPFVPFLGVTLGAVAAVLRQPIVAIALSKLFTGQGDKDDQNADPQ